MSESRSMIRQDCRGTSHHIKVQETEDYELQNTFASSSPFPRSPRARNEHHRAPLAPQSPEQQQQQLTPQPASDEYQMHQSIPREAMPTTSQPTPHPTTSSPDKARVELRHTLSLWAQLDSFTHRLSKFLAARSPNPVPIVVILKAVMFPDPCLVLMKPTHLYRYRADLFTHVHEHAFAEHCLQLTPAGMQLAQCADPDISKSHTHALASLAECDPMIARQESDIEEMKGRIAPSAWAEFKASVSEFCGSVSAKMAEKGEGFSEGA